MSIWPSQAIYVSRVSCTRSISVKEQGLDGGYCIDINGVLFYFAGLPGGPRCACLLLSSFLLYSALSGILRAAGDAILW